MNDTDDMSSDIATSLRIPRPLWNAIRAEAEANERSIAAQIRMTLKEHYPVENAVRARKGLRRISARAHSIRCYECVECATWADAVDGKKPPKCINCGGKAFAHFDSKGERDRWAQLKLLRSQGHITRLRRQVRLPFKLNGNEIFTYVADFDYYDSDGKYVIEDYKGRDITDLSELKIKLIEAQYGVSVRITTSR